MGDGFRRFSLWLTARREAGAEFWRQSLAAVSRCLPCLLQKTARPEGVAGPDELAVLMENGLHSGTAGDPLDHDGEAVGRGSANAATTDVSSSSPLIESVLAPEKRTVRKAG